VAEWVRVASVSESECGEEACIHARTADGRRIVLVSSGGEWFALEDKCSHQDFPLSEGEVEDGELECIFHGARFDLRTGKATRLPAIKPVKTYPVDVRNDEIFVDVS
jgi:3-phenylpropionate/trans-cinnamate dioxygenase ferredoxin component